MDQKLSLEKLIKTNCKNRVLGSAGSNHTCDPSGPNAGENIMDAIRMKGTGLMDCEFF